MRISNTSQIPSLRGEFRQITLSLTNMATDTGQEESHLQGYVCWREGNTCPHELIDKCTVFNLCFIDLLFFHTIWLTTPDPCLKDETDERYSLCWITSDFQDAEKSYWLI